MKQSGTDQTSLSGMNQPGMSQLRVSLLGMRELDMNQPSTSLPDTNQPGLKQPGKSQPGTSLPDANELGTWQPSPSQSGMMQPDMSQLGLSQPGPSQTGTWQLGRIQPGLRQPVMSQSCTSQSSTSQPGMRQAGPSQSGTIQPGPSQSSMCQLSMRQPGQSQSSMSQVGPSQSDPSQSGPTQPCVRQPGWSQSGRRQPSTKSFQIRPAEAEDCPEILRLIKELAACENMLDAVKLTATDLLRDGFGENPLFYCLIAEALNQQKPSGKMTIGFAMYYFAYDHWIGKLLYLEDFFVIPAYQGLGIGVEMLKKLSQIAIRSQCNCMQFLVVIWNQDSIEYYTHRGALDLSSEEGWHLFRVNREELMDMAREE